MPDFVFLAHVVDVMSSMHVPFILRSFCSMPFATKPFLILMWPFAFLIMLVMWAKSKNFLLTFYNIKENLHQTWVVPRFGFQVSYLYLLTPISQSHTHIYVCILWVSMSTSSTFTVLCMIQYFLPFATEGINKHIEEAILRADRLGVKVISLAALNKVVFSSYYPFFLIYALFLFFFFIKLVIYLNDCDRMNL